MWRCRCLVPPTAYIALKIVFNTSSPVRLEKEIKVLKKVGGGPHVMPLGGVVYSKPTNAVGLILPFFSHAQFPEILAGLSLHRAQAYMRALLKALAHLEDKKVIHRDIKPANFLCNPVVGSHVLVDFGLAEEVGSGDGDAVKVRGGRVEPNASRAGTRGFRAPEVLLRVPNQTCAVDVWSAGVIFISLITARYPVFAAGDDFSAIDELAFVFGTPAVVKAAEAMQRKLHLSQNHQGLGLRQFCNNIDETRPLGTRRPKPSQFSDNAYSLLEGLMALNPSERLTAKVALEHPWFKEK